MTPREFWEAAAQWGSYIAAGDPGACMYGFNERGCVQSEQHRQACLAWLTACRRRPSTKSHRDELDALRDYLLTTPPCGG